MVIPKKTVLLSSLSMATILAIASLASIGMMQTKEAAAAGNVIYKEKLKDDFASASKTIEEGSITTTVYASAFRTTSGNTEVILYMTKYDASTGTYLTDFYGVGRADELTIANGLGSATFSGTVGGTDYATGGSKYATVSADLTASGKAQTYTYRAGFTSPNDKFVLTQQGLSKPASGSLNIGEDLTFSTDDATGVISNVRQGSISVTRA
jgi:hypothetical protein